MYRTSNLHNDSMSCNYKMCQRNLDYAFQIYLGQQDLRSDRGLAGQPKLGHCRCEPLCLPINRCHLTVQSTRGPKRNSPLVTTAGYYGAQSQPVASAINDKGGAKKVKEKQKEVQLGKIQGQRGNENLWMKGGKKEKNGRIIVVMQLKVSC